MLCVVRDKLAASTVISDNMICPVLRYLFGTLLQNSANSTDANDLIHFHSDVIKRALNEQTQMKGTHCVICTRMSTPPHLYLFFIASGLFSLALVSPTEPEFQLLIFVD